MLRIVQANEGVIQDAGVVSASITIDIPLTPSRRKSIDPEDDDSKGGGSRGGGGGVDSQRSVALEAIAKLLESAATEKEARDEEEQKMMERGE